MRMLAFERIFEVGSNKMVMIGLFLAILELARNNLVTVEQQGDDTIFLKALTDEPAEQAVQNAIFATEPDLPEEEASMPEQNGPAIPIAEIPPKGSSVSQIADHEKTSAQQENQSN